MFPDLNLPTFQPRIKHSGARQLIFDPVRRRHVALTPEEWVRQHVINYLTAVKGYPIGLMTTEMYLRLPMVGKRTDVVVFDNAARPLLLVECKAPTVEISMATVEQISVYNQAIEARLLLLTNGMRHYCLRTLGHDARPEFLDDIPHFADAQ